MVEHELMIGSEAYRFKIDQLLLRANPTNAGAPYAIDVLAPVYGQPQPDAGAEYQYARRANESRVLPAGHGKTRRPVAVAASGAA